MIHKLLITTTLLTLFILPLPATVHLTGDGANPITRQITVADLVRTSIQDMETLLGTELKWKEKLVLRILRKKLRKAVRKDPQLASGKLSLQLGKDTLTLDAAPQDGNGTRLISGLSISSTLSVLLAFLLFIAGTPVGLFFCLLAPILGIAGLAQIRRKPEKFSGRFFAWLGIIIGGLTVALVGIVLISGFGAG